MAKIAFVTDSTAYLPPEVIEGLNIHVVPLQVIWGSETFRDGVDIQPAEFYTRLQDAKIMPSTSQPSPAAFMEVYKNLLEDGYEILSVHISNRLSGTMDSALQAKQNFPGQRIEVIDSITTSLAMGYQVLLAARAAQNGATLNECRILVEQAREKCGIQFAVNTLEFLRRGGRIGGAAAFLGTVLNLKPLLELKDGRIEAVERVRTMNKAVDRLLDLFIQQIGDRRPVRIGVIHALAENEARLLMERAKERLGQDVTEAIISPVSPVVGVHVGPGCMGLAYLAGM